MTAIDATGLGAFEELAETLHQSGRHMVLCGARHQPATLIARADFHRHVGDANICRNLEDALNRARGNPRTAGSRAAAARGVSDRPDREL